MIPCSSTSGRQFLSRREKGVVVSSSNLAARSLANLSFHSNSINSALTSRLYADSTASQPWGGWHPRPRVSSATVVVHAAQAAAPIAAAAASWWPLTPVTAVALSQLLTSAGIFAVCVAASVFLIACIPALWAMANTAWRAEAVLRVVEQELPESAALLRLSGIEMTECMSEVTSLGADLSAGVRSTASMATAVEQGVRQGVAVADRAISLGLIPMAARTEQAVRSALEAELQQRAQMTHTKQVIGSLGQAAGQAALAVRSARLGMKLAGLVGGVVSAGSGAVRRRAHAVAMASRRASAAQRTDEEAGI